MTRGEAAGGMLAAGLAASVAALAILAWLADRVASGAAIAFDGAIRAFVHEHSSTVLTELMRLASSLGATIPVLVLSAGAVAVLVATHSNRAALFFAVTMAGGFVLDATMKLGFHRARPASFYGTPEPNSYSFPSGHALFAACYFGILAAFWTARIRSRAARVLVWTAAAGMAGLIGYSRIYLGVHYPSDVVGGYAAAVIWVNAAAHADRLWGRGRGRS